MMLAYYYHSIVMEAIQEDGEVALKWYHHTHF